MNQLATVIQQLGLTGKPAEIVKAFDATVELSRDSTSYSLSGLAFKLASLGVDPMILIELRRHVRDLTIGGDTMEGLLLTGGGAAGGVDFSLDMIRFQVGANLQQPSTTDAQKAILAGMLAIGVRSGPQWQKSGLPGLPSEDECKIALTQIDVTGRWAALSNDMIRPMLETSTWDEIKAAVAGA